MEHLELGFDWSNPHLHRLATLEFQANASRMRFPGSKPKIIVLVSERYESASSVFQTSQSPADTEPTFPNALGLPVSRLFAVPLTTRCGASLLPRQSGGVARGSG